MERAKSAATTRRRVTDTVPDAHLAPLVADVHAQRLRAERSCREASVHTCDPSSGHLLTQGLPHGPVLGVVDVELGLYLVHRVAGARVRHTSQDTGAYFLGWAQPGACHSPPHSQERRGDGLPHACNHGGQRFRGGRPLGTATSSRAADSVLLRRQTRAAHPLRPVCVYLMAVARRRCRHAAAGAPLAAE